MNEEHQQAAKRILNAAEELREAVDIIPESMLTTSPGEDEWSAFETLLHIRNVAMMAYGLRIRRLVAEQEPIFANYDEESKNLDPLKQSQPVGEILDMIAGEHEAIGQLLALLPDEAWERWGRHPESGRLDIAFFVRRLAEHAEDHINQIKEIHQALS